MRSATTAEFSVTERYRRYVAWLLASVYLFNQVDRQIFAILQQPIKEAFHFSDTQLGLIGGTAFGLFYATLAIPIGRWADRGNRVNIIAGSLALWSLFTAIIGAARNFWQLFAARLLVGVGEAGCSPPAHSIISDYFEPKRRATAIAIYSLGVSGGSMIGLLIGSRVAEVYGWRTAFYFMGLPGLLLAAIVKLTLREPPRGFSDGIRPTQERPTVAQVVATLRAKRSFINLSIAAAIYTIAANGIGAFYSVFLIRSHHMRLSETGMWLALASLGGLAGTFASGKLADAFANRYRDRRWLLWVPAVVLTCNLPIGAVLYTASNKTVAVVLLFINVALSGAYLPPTVATTQRLVGPRERALASAILFLVMSFVGLIIGPSLAGFISDSLQTWFLSQGAGVAQASADGLRYAFLALLTAPAIAVVFYLRAARTVRDELID